MSVPSDNLFTGVIFCSITITNKETQMAFYESKEGRIFTAYVPKDEPTKIRIWNETYEQFSTGSAHMYTLFEGMVVKMNCSFETLGLNQNRYYPASVDKDSGKIFITNYHGHDHWVHSDFFKIVQEPIIIEPELVPMLKHVFASDLIKYCDTRDLVELICRVVPLLQREKIEHVIVNLKKDIK